MLAAIPAALIRIFGAATARVWLVGPGDRCGSCLQSFPLHRSNRVRLHLVEYGARGPARSRARSACRSATTRWAASQSLAKGSPATTSPAIRASPIPTGPGSSGSRSFAGQPLFYEDISSARSRCVEPRADPRRDARSAVDPHPARRHRDRRRPLARHRSRGESPAPRPAAQLSAVLDLRPDFGGALRRQRSDRLRQRRLQPDVRARSRAAVRTQPRRARVAARAGARGKKCLRASERAARAGRDRSGVWTGHPASSSCGSRPPARPRRARSSATPPASALPPAPPSAGWSSSTTSPPRARSIGSRASSSPTSATSCARRSPASKARLRCCKTAPRRSTSSPRSLLRIASRNSDRLQRLVSDILDLTSARGRQARAAPLRALAPAQLCEQAAEELAAIAAAPGLDSRRGSRLAALRSRRRRPGLAGQAVEQPALERDQVFARTAARWCCGPLQARDELRFAVEDQGPGVPPAFVDKLFTLISRNRTARSVSRQGTGLELAICQALVQQQGGVIGCSPRERVLLFLHSSVRQSHRVRTRCDQRQERRKSGGRSRATSAEPRRTLMSLPGTPRRSSIVGPGCCIRKSEARPLPGGLSQPPPYLHNAWRNACADPVSSGRPVRRASSTVALSSTPGGRSCRRRAKTDRVRPGKLFTRFAQSDRAQREQAGTGLRARDLPGAGAAARRRDRLRQPAGKGCYVFLHAAVPRSHRVRTRCDQRQERRKSGGRSRKRHQRGRGGRCVRALAPAWHYLAGAEPRSACGWAEALDAARAAGASREEVVLCARPGAAHAKRAGTYGFPHRSRPARASCPKRVHSAKIPLTPDLATSVENFIAEMRAAFDNATAALPPESNAS